VLCYDDDKHKFSWRDVCCIDMAAEQLAQRNIQTIYPKPFYEYLFLPIYTKCFSLVHDVIWDRNCLYTDMLLADHSQVAWGGLYSAIFITVWRRVTCVDVVSAGWWQLCDGIKEKLLPGGVTAGWPCCQRSDWSAGSAKLLLAIAGDFLFIVCSKIIYILPLYYCKYKGKTNKNIRTCTYT